MFVCLLYVAWAVLFCPYEPSPWLWIKTAAVAVVPAPIFVFVQLVQALLGSRRLRKDIAIELGTDEQPRLFHFIEKICRAIAARRVPFMFTWTIAPTPTSSRRRRISLHPNAKW